MAIHNVYPEQYQSQLDEKVARIKAQFAHFNVPDIKVFASPDHHFRMRAEFKIWHENGIAHYAMYEPGEYKKPYIIDSFPIGSSTINNLMPRLLNAINASELLKRKLFQAEFLTTTQGEAIITLIYHKPLDDAWQQEAEQLKTDLGVDIIGRSRKQKCVLGKDYVTEQLTVRGRTFYYQQVEASFTQPNAAICADMLTWACEQTQGIGGDLLELYCGNGNFTIPLSTHFERVLATEISKTSVNSALHNIQLNECDNIAIARMSSEEFSQAMDKERAFRRLKDINLDDYRFSTIVVDPPRAGLDDHTVAITQRFDHIVYISCNPNTLHDNLTELCKTHSVKEFALFDQFPYTDHIECGVLLRRR